MKKHHIILLLLLLISCNKKSNHKSTDLVNNIDHDTSSSLTILETIENKKPDYLKTITLISDKVVEIDNNIDSLMTNEYLDIDVYKEPGSLKYAFEGTQLYPLYVINMTTYSKMNKLVKIKVHFSGGYSDLYSEYYIENLKLIYNKKSLKTYRTSKLDDDHDSTKFKTIVNQLYFKSDSLIKWNKDNSYEDELYFKFTDIENDILNDYKLYLEITNANTK